MRGREETREIPRSIPERLSNASILLEGHRRVLEPVAPRGVPESLSNSQDARNVRNATEEAQAYIFSYQRHKISLPGQ